MLAVPMNDSFHFVHTTHAEFIAGPAACLAAAEALKPGVCADRSLVPSEPQFVLLSVWSCAGMKVCRVINHGQTN